MGRPAPGRLSNSPRSIASRTCRSAQLSIRSRDPKVFAKTSGMLRHVDAWQIGLIVLIVVGLAWSSSGPWDRARNRRRARGDARAAAADHSAVPTRRPAPHYLSDLQARAAYGTTSEAERPHPRSAASPSAGRSPAPRPSPSGPGTPPGTSSPTPTSGWAVLDQPAVLVCADPVDSIRELLPVLEQLMMTRTPWSWSPPDLAPEVLATLEVNRSEQTMRLLAVTPAAADLARPGRRLRRDADRPRRPAGGLPPGRPAGPRASAGSAPPRPAT